MVDNWFIENVVADINAGNMNNSIHCAELLSALVLWDKIYYPENENNWWQNTNSVLEYYLEAIPDVVDENELEIEKNIIADLINYQDIINGRAMHYFFLSQRNGVDYLPCAKRRMVFEEINNKSFYNKLYRLTEMRHIDERLRDYFKKAYHDLLEMKISFEMPILSRFIIQNTPCKMNPIEYALQLKNEGPLVSYRAYLSKIEDAIEAQDRRKLHELLNESIEVIEAVVRMDRHSIFQTNVTIVPSPNISFNLDLGSIRNHTHLTFIRDLTKYTLYDMEI